MNHWIEGITHIHTAVCLLQGALDEEAPMHRCVQTINDAVSSIHEAGVGAVMVERFYVAVGGHGWAVALSAADAKRHARRHAVKGTRFDVYKLPVGAHSVYVTDFGDVRWTLQLGAPRDGRAELVEKDGRKVEAEDVS